MTGAVTHIAATVSDRVLEYLEDRIIEGELAPGQRLAEEDIAARLGISRSPVREAFRRLEHNGLAVALLRKGVVVRTLEAGDADRTEAILRQSIEASGRRIAEVLTGKPSPRRQRR